MGLGDYLLTNRNADGIWESEQYSTGTIVSGLVSAYHLTGDERYKSAALESAREILHIAEETAALLGDEAFAVSRLGTVHESWLGELVAFYRLVEDYGTNSYLALYEGLDP